MSGGSALLVQVLHVVIVVVEGHAASLPWRTLDRVSQCVLLGVVQGVGVVTAAAAGAGLGWCCVDGGCVGCRETLPLLVVHNHVLQLNRTTGVGRSVWHVAADHTPRRT